MKIKHANGAVDNRYSIQSEYCGHSETRYVVRFCGNWVGASKTHSEAIDIANKHKWEHKA